MGYPAGHIPLVVHISCHDLMQDGKLRAVSGALIVMIFVCQVVPNRSRDWSAKSYVFWEACLRVPRSPRQFTVGKQGMSLP